MTPRDTILDLKARMSQDIVGQEHILERLIIGLLANGNLLVEGLSGLAKTRAVKSLAKHLDAGLSRIQFTPDLLPSDITGTDLVSDLSKLSILKPACKAKYRIVEVAAFLGDHSPISPGP